MIIDIPQVGQVEFPDDMTSEQIDEAILGDIYPAYGIKPPETGGFIQAFKSGVDVLQGGLYGTGEQAMELGADWAGGLRSLLPEQAGPLHDLYGSVESGLRGAGQTMREGRERNFAEARAELPEPKEWASLPEFDITDTEALGEYWKWWKEVAGQTLPISGYIGGAAVATGGLGAGALATGALAGTSIYPGLNLQAAEEAGLETDTGRRLMQVAVAPFQGALDAALFAFAPAKAVPAGLAKKISYQMLKGGLIGLAVEAPTEVAQKIAERFANGQELFSEEAIEAYKQDAIAAAAVGPVFGAALGPLNRGRQPIEAPPRPEGAGREEDEPTNGLAPTEFVGSDLVALPAPQRLSSDPTFVEDQVEARVQEAVERATQGRDTADAATLAGLARESVSPLGTFNVTELSEDLARRVTQRAAGRGQYALTDFSIDQLEELGATPAEIAALVAERRPLTAAQTAPSAADIEAKAQEKNFITKGDGQRYAESFKEFARQTVGRSNIGALTPEQRRVLYDKLAEMPVLSQPAEIPWVKAPSYSVEAYSRAEADAIANGKLTVGAVIRATKTQDPQTGKNYTLSPNTAREILSDLEKNGVLKKKGRSWLYNDTVRPADKPPPEAVTEAARTKIDPEEDLSTRQYEVEEVPVRGGLPKWTVVAKNVVSDPSLEGDVDLQARQVKEPVGTYETQQEAEEAAEAMRNEPVGATDLNLRQAVDDRAAEAETARAEEAARAPRSPLPADQRERLVNNILPKLRAQADKRGLGAMGIPTKVVKNITEFIRKPREKGIEGAFARDKDIGDVIALAWDAVPDHLLEAEPTAEIDQQIADYLAQRMDHEFVHALLANGFITEGQWKTLFEYARDTTVPGTQQTFLERAERLYFEDATLDARKAGLEQGTPEYDTHIRQYIGEEAVAEAFAQWASDPSRVSASIDSIFKRIVNAIRRILTAFRSEGYASPEEIMRDIASGDMVNRGATEAQGSGTSSRFSIDERGRNIEGTGYEQREYIGRARASGRQASVAAPEKPLPNSPAVKGATGPLREIHDVARRYAARVGISLRRQKEYVPLDRAFAKRLANAYEAMPNDINAPGVREAYAALIEETADQYQELVDAGYTFSFMDPDNDPYGGNPWNAMRDLHENKSMAVFPTSAGFGTSEAFDPSLHPMLLLTDIQWQGPDGLTPVTVNDLFRAVHDVFGHGMEGAGFRARGEENAWQAHANLFTEQALSALTTETRGQNSWLNFGPYGEANRTASVEDTVFGDQKVGLLPSWAWKANRDKGRIARKPSQRSPKFSRSPEEQINALKRTKIMSHFAGWDVDAVLNDVQDPRSRSTLVLMSPDEFIAMTPKQLRNPGQETVFKQNMLRGLQLKQIPYLSMERVGDSRNAKVIGHEGRHRAHALKALGYDLIPVEIRHLNEMRWGVNDISDRPTKLEAQSPDTDVIVMPDSVPFPAKETSTVPLDEEGRPVLMQIGAAPQEETLDPVAHAIQEAFPASAAIRTGEFDPSFMRNAVPAVFDPVAQAAEAAGATDVLNADALGKYGNWDPEFSSGLAATFPAGTKPEQINPVAAEVFRVAQQEGQEEAFVTLEADDNFEDADPENPTIRPGITVFFLPEVGGRRTGRTREQVMEIIDGLQTGSVGGFTAFSSVPEPTDTSLFRDHPEAAARDYEGLTFLWTPEYMDVPVDELNDAFTEVMEDLETIEQTVAKKGIGSSQVKYYHALLTGDPDYETTIEALNAGDPGGAAGGPWGRSIRESVQAAAERNRRREASQRGDELRGGDGTKYSRRSNGRHVRGYHQSGAPLQVRPLPVVGTGPNEKILNWDIADAFINRHVRQFGRKLDPINNTEDFRRIANMLYAEYVDQTGQGDTGSGWYVEDVAEALNKTALILPEIKRNASNRDMFMMMAAILSPQKAPTDNWADAIEAMQQYWEAQSSTNAAGVIPLRKRNGAKFGTQTQALQLFNYLLERFGQDGAIDWLLTEHTGREIADMREASGIYNPANGNYKASETRLNGYYLGMRMFGPKVADFYQNASGFDDKAVTVDTWAARTYYRHTGQLHDVGPKARAAKEPLGQVNTSSRRAIVELFTAVAERAGTTPSAMQAQLWYFEQRLYRNHGANSRSENFSGAADTALRKHGIDPRRAEDVRRSSGEATGDLQRTGEARGTQADYLNSLGYGGDVRFSYPMSPWAAAGSSIPGRIKQGRKALHEQIVSGLERRYPKNQISKALSALGERYGRGEFFGRLKSEFPDITDYELEAVRNLYAPETISAINPRYSRGEGIDPDDPAFDIPEQFDRRGETFTPPTEDLSRPDITMPPKRATGPKLPSPLFKGVSKPPLFKGVSKPPPMPQRTEPPVSPEKGRYRVKVQTRDTTNTNQFKKPIWRYFFADSAADAWRIATSSPQMLRGDAEILELEGPRGSIAKGNLALNDLRDYYGPEETMERNAEDAWMSQKKDKFSRRAPPGQRGPQATARTGRIAEADFVRIRTHGLISRILHNDKRIRNPFTGKLMNSVVDMRIAMQDQMLPLGMYEDELLKRGGHLDDNTMAYMNEQLSHGKTVDEIRINEETLYKPLLEAIKAAPFSLALFEQYLYARHAKIRNAFGWSKMDPNMIDPDKPPSGMTDQMADELMDAFTKSKHIRTLENVAAIVDGIVANTNLIRRQAELIDDDIMDGGLDYFVPLRGGYEEEIDGTVTAIERERMDDVLSMPRTGKRGGIRGREDMSITGRRTEATNIIAHLLMQNEEAIIRANRNQVLKSFAESIRQNKDLVKDLAWEVESYPMRKVADKKTGFIKLMPDFQATRHPDFVTFKEIGPDGKLRETHLQTRDRRLATSLNGLASPDVAGGFINVLGRLNRFLASVNTSWNPEFMLSNMLRDLGQAAVVVNQYEIPGITKAVLKGTPSALRGVQIVLRGIKSPAAKDHQYAEDFKRLQELGGTTEFMGIKDLDTILKNIASGVDDVGKASSLKKGWEHFKKLGKFVEDYNKVVENGVRLSTYSTLVREHGVSEKKAAFVAKNLTVNFTKGGNQKALMNSMYLFYNASLQGTWVLMNALRSKKVQKIAGGIVAAGFLSDTLNAMMSDDSDNDGRLDYDDIDDWNKEHAMLFMDPTHMGGKQFQNQDGTVTPGFYGKIPLPYGLNAFWNMGRVLSALTRPDSGMTAGQAATSIGVTFLDAFNPIGGTSSFWNFVSPTVLDPVFDLVGNENFARQPIMPERISSGAQPAQPNSQLYWNNTSPPFIAIADWMNRITRGNEFRPGTIDVSPNQLDYVFDYVLGGVGAFTLRTFDPSEGTPANLARMFGATNGQFDMNQVSLARKFIGTVGNIQARRQFYNNASDVMMAEKEYKGFLEAGNATQANRVFKKYQKQLQIAPFVKASERNLARARRRLKDVRANPHLSDKMRKTLEDQIKEEQDRYMNQVNRVYNQYVRGK
jgi:hypothetical protein